MTAKALRWTMEHIACYGYIANRARVTEDQHLDVDYIAQQVRYFNEHAMKHLELQAMFK